MSARENILAGVRANRPLGDHPLPELPIFPFEAGEGLVASFLRNLEAMGGHGIEGQSIDAFLQEQFPQAKVIASAVPEYRGNRDLMGVAAPRDLADVDITIVRASFGVAETGSVLLPDTALVTNAAAYLAQHLVVLLAPAAIVPTLQEAYRRPEFHEHRYASFHTGPSATADIEGVLIHGAQGVRSLTVLLLDAAV